MAVELPSSSKRSLIGELAVTHRLGTGEECVAQALSRTVARGSGPELWVLVGILFGQVRQLPAALAARRLPAAPPGLA